MSRMDTVIFVDFRRRNLLIFLDLTFVLGKSEIFINIINSLLQFTPGFLSDRFQFWIFDTPSDSVLSLGSGCFSIFLCVWGCLTLSDSLCCCCRCPLSWFPTFTSCWSSVLLCRSFFDSWRCFWWSSIPNWRSLIKRDIHLNIIRSLPAQSEMTFSIKIENTLNNIGQLSPDHRNWNIVSPYTKYKSQSRSRGGGVRMENVVREAYHIIPHYLDQWRLPWGQAWCHWGQEKSRPLYLGWRGGER